MRFLIPVVAIAVLVLSACVSNTSNDLAAIQREELLLASVVSPARPAEHVAQDAQRRPFETMLFARVNTGQRVLEISPGEGYYTRLLAQAIGPTGRLYVVVAPDDAGARAVFGELAERYGNIELVTDIAAVSTLDMVWVLEADGGFDAAAIASVLVPGGVLYVESSSLGDLVQDAADNNLGLEGREDRTAPPVIGLRFQRR